MPKGKTSTFLNDISCLIILKHNCSNYFCLKNSASKWLQTESLVSSRRVILTAPKPVFQRCSTNRISHICCQELQAWFLLQCYRNWLIAYSSSVYLPQFLQILMLWIHGQIHLDPTSFDPQKFSSHLNSFETIKHYIHARSS